MKKNLFQLTSLFVIICIFVGSYPSAVFASDTVENPIPNAEINEVNDIVDYQAILGNSYVLHANRGFYFDNGEKKYFDNNNKNYILPCVENKILIPVTLLQEWTGMKYQWSGNEELLKMNLNGNTVAMRLREDAISINGEYKYLGAPAQYIGNKTFVPFMETMQGLGFNTFFDSNGLTVVSLTEKLPLDKGDNVYVKEALNDLFNDYLFTSSFEKTKVGSASMLNNRLGADGWNFGNWANPISPKVDAGMTTEAHASGGMSAYIDAVDKSFAGFETVKLPFDKKVPAYEVEYKVKTSKDYLNNNPFVLFLCYIDSKFVASIIRGTSVANADGWTTNKFIFHSTMYPSQDINLFSVVVATQKAGTDDLKPSGRVYFDDVKIRVCEPDTTAIKAEIQSNVLGNWYVLGDEAIFKCSEPEALSSLVKVKGIVYNSYDEVVDEKSITAKDMINNGWVWKAKQPGFYEVEFWGVQPDGTKLPIIGYFAETAPSHAPTHQALFERIRHSFVFTANKTKPIEERNDRMYFSEKGDSEIALQLADKVGFSGIRIHWIPWGPTGGFDECISPEKGVFNWGFFDDRMKNIGKYGYNVIGNILFTPQWASSHPELSGLNSYGMYKYSVYAPADMSVWEDFVKRLANRYKEQIGIWEIWNEPHIPGSSTFWNDSPENYVELLKTAYTAIKEIQPEGIVTIGGLGARRYTPFYKEILKTDVYDYFDVLALHGTQLDPWNYNGLAEKVGYNPKPYMNTEGHYILLNSTSSPKIDYTETEMSFRMLKEYFRDFKGGALATTIFRVLEGVPKETLPFFKKVNLIRDNTALFRNKPYLEPRHITSVLHTLLDLMGKEFTYVAEYELENDQKGVLFNNDGKPLFALWRENGNKFVIDKSLAECMTKDSVIIDWEGKEIDLNTPQLTGSTMYFISGLDSDKLNLLEKSDDKVIFNEYEKAKSNLVVPIANANKFTLFDAKTFKMSENIEWIESDWKWVKVTDEKPEDFSAKYAVSMDTKGMYLVVDVADGTFVGNGDDSVNNSWKYDSMQFSLDTIGDAAPSDRAEFQVGLSKNGPELFKDTAPHIGGNLPDNWSKSGSTLSKRFVNIENADGHIIYKVFVPMSELYPYAYTGGKDQIRLSVLVNNNNGDGRMGYLEWSSGIGAAKDPEYYGKINIGQK